MRPGGWSQKNFARLCAIETTPLKNQRNKPAKLLKRTAKQVRNKMTCSGLTLKGKWSPADEEKLWALLNRPTFKNEWTKLGKIFNRTAEQVRQKVTGLTRKQRQTRSKPEISTQESYCSTLEETDERFDTGLQVLSPVELSSFSYGQRASSPVSGAFAQECHTRDELQADLSHSASETVERLYPSDTVRNECIRRTASSAINLEAVFPTSLACDALSDFPGIDAKPPWPSRIDAPTPADTLVHTTSLSVKNLKSKGLDYPRKLMCQECISRGGECRRCDFSTEVSRTEIKVEECDCKRENLKM